MIQLLLITLMLISICQLAEVSPDSPWECVSPKAECNLNTCLPLYLCPELVKTIGNITINSTADEIPEKYFCQKYGENLPCVCCPSQDEDAPAVAIAPSAEQNLDKSYLIPPSFECCNRKSVLFAYGGKPISFGEFPSLAILRYVDSSGNISFPCAGTLISKQYVLTAAHCVTGKILEKAGKLTKVRLGEHDLSNTVCVDGKCNHGVQEIGIDKVIIHEKYADMEKSNDITLIRLAKPLKHFQINILPICLRWIHNSPSPIIGPNHNFTVVGWGRTLQERQSKIGNKVYLRHYNRDKCAERYARYKLSITDKQICAGGEFKVDACDGDSGGPLLSNIDECDYHDGIVSFGRGCGLENWPGIYTNVTAYRDWIMEHIEP